MSRTIEAFDGHVGVYAGGLVSGAGERLIGLQVEHTHRTSPISTTKDFSSVRLTHAQALEVALELLERATDKPAAASVRACLRGTGFVP